MKKIMVNYLGRTGGATLYSFEMTKGLIEQGALVSAVISSQNELLNEWKKLRFEKLIIIPTYTNKKNFLLGTLMFFCKYRRIIKKAFQNDSFDAIYCPHFHPWFKYVNNIVEATKTIITLHDPIPHSGSFFKYKIIWLYLKKRLIAASDIVILSQIFKNDVMRMYRKDDKHVHVIPHGIFDYYKQINKSDHLDSFYDEKSVNFLFFGRIEPYKGLAVLGEAYKIICEKYCNVTLTIAGNGDFSSYADIYKDAKNFRLINRWIDDDEISNFFYGPNIVAVLPYIDATQSGVVSISILFGDMIIGTDTGGLREQIAQNNIGLLAKPNDVSTLVEMMEKVITDKRICDNCIDNGKRLVESLKWNNLAKMLIDSI